MPRRFVSKQKQVGFFAEWTFSEGLLQKRPFLVHTIPKRQLFFSGSTSIESCVSLLTSLPLP
jgi:hypothetical protein